MKKIIPSILLAATASSNLLVAQVDNLGQDLNCQLMMNPSLEEGVNRLGEVLGNFKNSGQRIVVAKGIAAEDQTIEMEVEENPIASSSSYSSTQESTEAVQFSDIRCTVEPLKNAVQARSNGKEEVAKAYERQAQYELQAAQSITGGCGGISKGQLVQSYHFEIAANNARIAAERELIFGSVSPATGGGFFQGPVLTAVEYKTANMGSQENSIAALSEFKNRCLAFDAKITRETGRVDIAKQFKDAASIAEEAITTYRQFDQKMKEGDVSAASLLRIKGFSLEWNTLEKEYCIRAKEQAMALGCDNEGKNFPDAAHNVRYAVTELEEAVQAMSKGQAEVAEACWQAAQYRLQAAQKIAADNIVYYDPCSEQRCPKPKENLFSKAANFVCRAAKLFEKVVEARSCGQEEVAKSYEQAVQYYFQAAQAAANGDNTNAEVFLKNAEDFSNMARSKK